MGIYISTSNLRNTRLSMIMHLIASYGSLNLSEIEIEEAIYLAERIICRCLETDENFMEKVKNLNKQSNIEIFLYDVEA